MYIHFGGVAAGLRRRQVGFGLAIFRGIGGWMALRLRAIGVTRALLLGYHGAMQTPDLTEFCRFAEQLADAARSITMKWFRNPVTIETKVDQSPVTIADREVELTIRRLVEERYPHHGFIGEEYDNVATDQEFAWIVDPIDGTQQFITGVPLFGTLIGLLIGGRPVVGVVDVPAMHERWVGVHGRRTLLNGNPCATGNTTDLADASIFTTSPYVLGDRNIEIYDRVSRQCRTRRFGLDCYAYSLLASGYVDVVMEAGLQSFDILPIVPVIEGAGGRVSDWDGRDLTLTDCDRVLAVGNDRLHIAVIDQIRAATEAAATERPAG